MKTQQTHTPTPWQVGTYATTKRFERIDVHTAITNDDGLLIGVTGPKDDGPSIADAAFIVRAVNSHEALIQAVKDLRYAFYVENSPKKLKDAFSKHADSLRKILSSEELEPCEK